MNGKQLFVVSVGIFLSLVLLVCACAIPFSVDGESGEKKAAWWPLFTLLFYAIAAIPSAFCPILAGPNSDTASAWLSFGDFLVAVVGTSIFGFPAVLCVAGTITVPAFILCITSGLSAIATSAYVSYTQGEE